MDYDDRVKRLRTYCRLHYSDDRTDPCECGYASAADAITALQTRVAELEGQNKLLIEVANFGVRPDVHQRALQRAERAEAESEALRHDIERHVAITSAQAQEIEELRARVAALEHGRTYWVEAATKEEERAERAENDLAAARALLVKASPLLKEVVISHADPDDPSYNECEKPNARCAWCEDAQAILDAALAAPGEGK